jgi:hypothetical protein
MMGSDNKKRTALQSFFLFQKTNYLSSAKIEAVMSSTLPEPLTLR